MFYLDIAYSSVCLMMCMGEGKLPLVYMLYVLILRSLSMFFSIYTVHVGTGPYHIQAMVPVT